MPRRRCGFVAEIRGPSLALVLLGAMTFGAVGQEMGQVSVLAHPHPYSASVTVLSDLHNSQVDEFEAIRRLVNSSEMISPGSEAWTILGFDRWLDGAGDSYGVRGFGFPFADTFWLYGLEFAFFKDYDPELDRFIRHDDENLESVFSRWFEQGYVESLHTFGPGEITRVKAAAAVDYFLERFDKPVTVHVNHSKQGTPAGVAPPCCTLLSQTLVHLRYVAYGALGQSGRLASPMPLPDNPLPRAYLLLVVSAVAGLVLAFLLLFRRRNKSRILLLTLAVLVVLPVARLQGTWVDFYRGDNPESPMYNRDLLARLGVRFYWSVSSPTWAGTTGGLALPETETAAGRKTIFSTRRFDDGSEGLHFQRSGNGEPATLRLLSHANLDQLVESAGRSILYAHWAQEPRRWFDSGGIESLRNLAEYRDRELVWTPPASRLLAQAYAYAYVTYSSSTSDGRTVVTIDGFDDPIEGRRSAKVEELSDLSFLCKSCADITLVLNGEPIPDHRLERALIGDDVVVTITGGAESHWSRTELPS